MPSFETICSGDGLSAAARARMLSIRGEPLFIADWDRVLMMHYEVEPHALADFVPFQLDLFHGRAFVSLVAFTMRNMRLRFGGNFGALLVQSIANHEFLNVRTYVRHRSESGIYFLAEWLPNRLSVALGPRFFGLPYRWGAIKYGHHFETGVLHGFVRDRKTGEILEYKDATSENESASFGTPQFALRTHTEPGSLYEWLMERYTAFTAIGRGPKRFFRVWHPPWQQMCVEINVTNATLLESNWRFFRDARRIGSNFSPGLKNVWMGRPQSLIFA